MVDLCACVHEVSCAFIMYERSYVGGALEHGSACEQTRAAVAVGSAQQEQADDPVYHPSEHANGALEFTFVEPGPLGITFGDVAVR